MTFVSIVRLPRAPIRAQTESTTHDTALQLARTFDRLRVNNRTYLVRNLAIKQR